MRRGSTSRWPSNVTGRDLLDLGFPDEVAALLEKWDVPPAALELEITENTILTNATRAQDVLDRLSALGVRLAIDDFGKGHSSLEHLAQLPIDVLKIDRSFVMHMAQPTNAAIVRSTIDLAHNLGLEVVAEGVETDAAALQLAALGCDTLQGFLLSRPVPADRLGGVIPAPASRGAKPPERRWAGRAQCVRPLRSKPPAPPCRNLPLR